MGERGGVDGGTGFLPLVTPGSWSGSWGNICCTSYKTEKAVPVVCTSQEVPRVRLHFSWSFWHNSCTPPTLVITEANPKCGNQGHLLYYAKECYNVCESPTVSNESVVLSDKLSGWIHGHLLFWERYIFHLKQIFRKKRTLFWSRCFTWHGQDSLQAETKAVSCWVEEQGTAY